MATTALGPTMAGGIQPIIKDGYELIYYPDVNNDALQNEGKPPVFYWLPNYVHIARKDGRKEGDLMFLMLRFAGKQTSEGNIGLEDGESREVAGGVLAVTTTAAPPDHVLEQGQQEIISMYQGKVDYFWGIRSSVKPIFRPVVITSNHTSISNLSPNADGSVVQPVSGTPASPGTPANPAAPAAPASPSAPSAPGAPTRQVRYETVPVPRFITQQGFTTRSFDRRNVRDGNLDPWYFNMQGQGNGSIDPMGQNAYTGLLGVYPASILYQSFKMAYTPVRVCQAMKVKFWVPIIEITIKGNWERIFEHFSANAKGKYLWFSADIKAEFNNMRISGGIEVDVKVDPTIPGAEKIQEYVDKKTDLISQKFMEQAKGIIFDPPQPNVQAAEASSSGGLFGLWGAGVALKYRRDSTRLNLNYHEKRQLAYLQDHVISSNLEGAFDEMKKDPDAEKKYFVTIYMDDWPRKLARIIKPVVNWPQPAQNWAGEPVSFLSVQVGYPNTAGEIDWVGHVFESNGSPTDTWKIETTQKAAADVSNAPANWAPDKTFIKRKVHMMEPPDPIANPFVRVQIEDNEIDLDPGEYGTMVNDVTLELRADEAGRIRVGPIGLNVALEDNKQMVEVTFQAVDENGADITRFPPQKFIWKDLDQETSRFWSVFTSDATVRSFFKYQVRVIIKGSLFTKGMEWTGPWVNTIGNGPLTISVPSTEDEGVVIKRDIQSKAREISSQPPTSSASREITPPTQPVKGSYAVEEGVKMHQPPTGKTPLSRKIAGRAVSGNGGWKQV
ncbi:hypothetical protein ACFSQD_04440 [Flavihumibacter stibioxidans]|uniref:Uncharacterized protein n=1 Tax=Flavihumibacter stibioxidans TaxID=1834163 RepID=A0ABR7M3K9_9BACT|nr:hypothetical protein [Flavihumibacter stibioxidans]MBC6489557.1 hypothetical protein [Flavihumibacter stibioxidans]